MDPPSSFTSVGTQSEQCKSFFLFKPSVGEADVCRRTVNYLRLQWNLILEQPDRPALLVFSGARLHSPSRDLVQNATVGISPQQQRWWESAEELNRKACAECRVFLGKQGEVVANVGQVILPSLFEIKNQWRGKRSLFFIKNCQNSSLLHVETDFSLRHWVKKDSAIFPLYESVLCNMVDSPEKIQNPPNRTHPCQYSCNGATVGFLLSTCVTVAQIAGGSIETEIVSTMWTLSNSR